MWVLDRIEPWQGIFGDYVSLYAGEGNIRFGLFEIATLLPFPLFQVPSRTRSPTGTYHKTGMHRVSHTLMKWYLNVNSDRLLWDTLHEDEAELSRAIDTKLLELSIGFEAHYKAPHRWQRLLSWTTRKSPLIAASSTETPTRRRTRYTIEHRIRYIYRLLALLRQRSWTSTSDAYLLLRGIVHDIDVQHSWLDMSASAVQRLYSERFLGDKYKMTQELRVIRVRAKKGQDECMIAFLNSWS
jgi:hypothetical protein